MTVATEVGPARTLRSVTALRPAVRSQAKAQAQTQVSPRPVGRSAHTHTDSPAAMRRRQRRQTDSTDTAAGMRKVVDINLAQNFRESRFSSSEPRPNVGPELNVKIHKQI